MMGVRAVAGVGLHRGPCLAFSDCSQTCHSGVEVIGGLAAHPGGEAFVEPEIVPPGPMVTRSPNQLVRHLVRDDREDLLLVPLGGDARVEEQRAPRK